MARSIGEPDDRIERRIEAPCLDLSHDGLISLSRELKNIGVAGLINAAINNDRQVDWLSICQAVVGFLFERLRQSIQSKRDTAGTFSANSERINSGSGVLGGWPQCDVFEVPAIDFRIASSAHPATQGKDAGDEWQLANRDAIHEILAPAEEAVVDGERIFSIARDLVENGGIGFETVI